jgi:hypothetical protein
MSAMLEPDEGESEAKTTERRNNLSFTMLFLRYNYVCMSRFWSVVLSKNRKGYACILIRSYL